MADIAVRSGYDRSHFHRSFKAACGISPQTWRATTTQTPERKGRTTLVEDEALTAKKHLNIQPKIQHERRAMLLLNANRGPVP